MHFMHLFKKKNSFIQKNKIHLFSFLFTVCKIEVLQSIDCINVTNLKWCKLFKSQGRRSFSIFASWVSVINFRFISISESWMFCFSSAHALCCFASSSLSFRMLISSCFISWSCVEPTNKMFYWSSNFLHWINVLS